MKADEVMQFDQVLARFEPRRTDDLVPGAGELIGHQTYWQAVWEIEEGPYAGEWAMRPMDRRQYPFAWVPLGDLGDLHG